MLPAGVYTSDKVQSSNWPSALNQKITLVLMRRLWILLSLFLIVRYFTCPT
jgi:hypothetical protein